MSLALMPGRRLDLRIVAAFATIYLVWGSTFLAIRVGVRQFPPLLFAGGRFLLAGALLWAIAFALRERLPRTAREWRLAALFSLLMITFSNGLTTVALQHIHSNEGALLAASSALWITAFGAIGPRGHALTVRGTAGLLIGFAGVALILWPREVAAPGHLAWQALVVGSSLSWAIGTIAYRDAALDGSPIAFNAAVMSLGGAWLLLGGFAAGEWPRVEWRPGGLAALVYLAVFGSALAYTAYAWLLTRVRADVVGTFAFVNPAVAALLGWAVLDEVLGPLQIAGMLIVLAGVALVTLPGKVRQAL